jgi:hypothetical protein
MRNYQRLHAVDRDRQSLHADTTEPVLKVCAEWSCKMLGKTMLYCALLFFLAGENAYAQMSRLECEDRGHIYPPNMFDIDIQHQTVHWRFVDPVVGVQEYTVHAHVTDSTIEWAFPGDTYFSLDRYSLTMNRSVLHKYFTTWDCHTMQQKKL